MPVAWDESKFIDGYPGKFAVVARRKGAIWYVVGINGENQPREFSLQPQAFAEGVKTCMSIRDGASATEFEAVERPYKPGETLPVKMLPHGGFAFVLK